MLDEAISHDEVTVKSIDPHEEAPKVSLLILFAQSFLWKSLTDATVH